MSELSPTSKRKGTRVSGWVHPRPPFGLFQCFLLRFCRTLLTTLVGITDTLPLLCHPTPLVLHIESRYQESSLDTVSVDLPGWGLNAEVIRTAPRTLKRRNCRHTIGYDDQARTLGETLGDWIPFITTNPARSSYFLTLSIHSPPSFQQPQYRTCFHAFLLTPLHDPFTFLRCISLPPSTPTPLRPPLEHLRHGWDLHSLLGFQNSSFP